MDSSDQASKLILEQTSTYVRDLETTHSNKCNEEVRAVHSEKVKGLKNESKAAKNELNRRMSKANAIIKSVENLQALAQQVNQKKDRLTKDLTKVLDTLNTEKTRFEDLDKSFSLLKSDVEALGAVDLDSSVSLDEAQKWENRANFLKEHQQKLSIKSAEVLSMKEDITQRRELMEKKLTEKALLEAKLDQMRQEKIDNENAKKQKEEIIDKLRSELTEKEVAVSAKSESLEQEQQQLFENGRVSYDISKLDIKMALMHFRTELLPLTEFVKNRLKLRADQREVYEKKMEKKQQEVDKIRAKIEEIKKNHEEETSVMIKKEAQKQEIFEEIAAAKSELVDLESKEALKKQLAQNNTPESRPFVSSTPIVTKKETIPQKRSNIAIPIKVKKSITQNNRSNNRGTAKKNAAQAKKKANKRPWESDSEDSYEY